MYFQIGVTILLVINIPQQIVKAQGCPNELKFSCDISPNRETEVTFETPAGSEKLYCAEETICNYINRPPNCGPCIDKSPKCFGLFTCDHSDRPKVVTIQKIEVECLDGFCNANYTPPCDPCVTLPCSDEQKNRFECVKGPGKENKVILLDEGPGELSCGGDNVCNFEKVHPCTPCILKTSNSKLVYYKNALISYSAKQISTFNNNILNVNRF